MEYAQLNQDQFRKLLARNVSLPLFLTIGLSAIFVGLVLFLISVSDWVDHTDAVISKAHQLESLALEAESGTRGFLVSGVEHFLAEYNDANAIVGSKINELKNLVSDNPPQVAKLAQIQSLYSEWLKVSREYIELRRAGGDYQKAVRSEKAKTLMSGLRRHFREFVAVENELRSRRVEQTTQTTQLTLAVVIILGLFVGGLLAFLGRKQLIGLSKTYGDALKNQIKQNEILKDRDWTRSGQTRLSEKIRGDNSLEQVCSAALNFLATYLDAQVGALFVRGEDGEYQRLATYAYPPAEAEAPKKLRPGQGLLGQAMAERRTFHLTTLPTDYIQVQSDIGRSRPAEALIFPLFSDGVTIGAVELGTLSHFSPLQKEFAETVSEALGIAIKTAQYRGRLEALLEETQRQAEELQTQQEELRVSNEELEQQTRALRDSQTRLEGQQAELEQSNTQLEEQAQLLGMQKRKLDERNEELNQTARDLEAASRYKSEFMANMSHELRTPLNSTLILLRLLIDNKGGNLSGEQLKYLNIIEASSNDLLTLINDILDLSKVESGKLDLQSEEVSPRAVLESLERLFMAAIQQKGLSIHIEIDPALSGTLLTDRLRLEQILRNFISNAVKFTEKGAITLKAESRAVNGGRPKTGAPSADDRVAFSVIDTGIGIPQDKKDLIFEAFRQADGSISRKYGGTGLGLSIAKELARLLGGEILVESNADKGSTFTLILPLQMPETAAEAAKSIAASKTKHITLPEKTVTLRNATKPASEKRHRFDFEDDRNRLSPGEHPLLIVEDDQNFAKVLFEAARGGGMKALVAGTAAEGIELAQEYTPLGVILDLGLPDHSGLLVLDQLKASPRTRHIPVHVISGKNDSRPALDMGAIGYLQKPASAEHLREALENLSNKASQGIKQLLVVEDDPVQREAVVKLIGDDGVETTAVENGAHALEALKAKTFDCMIMDLKLPDMSGDELLEKMSETNLSSFPPVIVYTARTLTRDEEEKLMRRSRTIVIKGARSPDRLLSEVMLFLHQIEDKLPRERQSMLSEFRAREKVFSGRKILIADDDVRNIFALTNAMESKGAQVIPARNGREALQRLEEHPDVGVILMDIMMPEMDGYEAIRMIRSSNRFSDIPIIAVTARAMRDDQERALSCGANDYLAKPIDLDRLLSLIRVWMPKVL